MHPARNFLIHLRLPFQLLLAPFMLFGAAMAHGKIGLRFALAFVILHLCIYGGTTAFNSHYDKDEGPIGGLENPPPPGTWLLPGGIAIQLVGLALAPLVSLSFFGVCLLFAVLGVLYSHPLPRFKRSPWASWITVMVGQGMLGALAGATAVDAPRISHELFWGVGAAALLVGGLYPISQIFQLEEDRARGDRTVALTLGRRGTVIASSILYALGAACLVMSALAAGRMVDAALFLLAPLPMTLGAYLACKDVPRAFRRVMAFQLAASVVFAAYSVVRLATDSG